MNRSSLAALEYPTLLQWLAELTSFSAGRERALALEPATALAEVRSRLTATGEAQRVLHASPELGFGGVHDVRPQLERAALGGELSPEELLDVAAVLLAAERWIQTLGRLSDTYPTLAAIVAPLLPHRDVRLSIGEAIGDDARVLDTASAELAQVRASLRTAQERLVRRLQDLVATPGLRAALQEPIVTQREGRYVVPVKAEARGQVRGIVHDQSASGATLFVEPFEVVELSNRWRQFQREEAAEVERVLRALSADVGARSNSIGDTVEALAELDLHQAKARLAERLDAVMPEMVELTAARTEAPLRLGLARHPLLERTLGRERVVPITLELGRDIDVLLVTGPNTGGKTVALKTVGLLALMAQAGMFLPVEAGSRLPLFDSVFADIGDEQSIQQSLSTFSSHIARIVEMLRHANSATLVLLDELGAGTDPEEGAALARSLLDELLTRRCLCIATSHYSELKSYAHATPRVENSSVEFDLETLAPTYRLSVGLPGRSNALAIAGRLGMPGPIVERARAFLRPREREVASMLEQLHVDRAAADEAREAAARDALESLERSERLQEVLRQAEEDRARAWDQARRESEAELAELRREIRLMQRRLERAGGAAPEVAEIAATASALQSVRRPRGNGGSASRTPVSGPTPSLREGAEVHVPSLGVNGTVLSLTSGGRAEVSVNGMRVLVRESDLQPLSQLRSSLRPAEPFGDITVSREAAHVPSQLDLRGMRREEAVSELDHYLHDAFMAGLPQVRVVHGRGTGAVRAAVRDLLGGHSLVKDFAAGGRAEGGDGATIVSLAV